MSKKIINHGSRHRPSLGRRKYREGRASGENPIALAQELNPECERDDWSDDEDYLGFEGKDHFGLHWDGSAELLGGLLSGAELQRLVDSAVWQELEVPAWNNEPVYTSIDEEWEPLPSEELIEALLSRFQELRAARDWQECITAPDEDLRMLRSFWHASDERLTAATAPRGYCLPYQLGLIALLEPFWLRPAVSWQSPGGDDRAQFASLLKHLFVRYPVPRFLLEGVNWIADRHNWKWLLWLVLMGSGASMVRAGRRFGWWMNNAFMQQLMRAPAHLDATSACTWAEVRRCGGSEALADAFSSNPAFNIDPTEVDRPEAPRSEPLLKLSDMNAWQFDSMEFERAQRMHFRQLWQTTLEWLIRYESEIPLERLGAVLAWANHEFTEQRRRPGNARQAFSWKGRTPAATLRAAEEYQERLHRHQGPNRQWDAKGWDWQVVSEADAEWSMRELTCSDELFEEGKAMHHCVAGYDLICVAGESAIFSLCANGARVLTIEIDPETHQIRQALGECNRRATSAELEMVNKWRIERVSVVSVGSLSPFQSGSESQVNAILEGFDLR